MNTPTDTQLKSALSKMLPEKIEMQPHCYLLWQKSEYRYVRDTELLNLCWVVEMSLSDFDYNLFCNLRCEEKERNREMRSHQSASWQQRVRQLAKLKGIEL